MLKCPRCGYDEGVNITVAFILTKTYTASRMLYERAGVAFPVPDGDSIYDRLDDQDIIDEHYSCKHCGGELNLEEAVAMLENDEAAT